jgi:hypothetical protein
MNIFVTDFCPVISAVSLPDKLVNKMATESCQMISIIYSPWYYNWGTIPKKDGTPYNTEKGTHRNHPCTKWAANSHENLAWLIRHGFALCNEYRHRYNKIHACLETLYVAEDIFIQKTKETIGIYHNVTEFVRAMPDEFKFDTSIDTFEAYKIYLNTKPYVAGNYLRIPSRKPDWLNNKI